MTLHALRSAARRLVRARPARLRLAGGLVTGVSALLLLALLSYHTGDNHVARALSVTTTFFATGVPEHPELAVLQNRLGLVGAKIAYALMRQGVGYGAVLPVVWMGVWGGLLAWGRAASHQHVLWRSGVAAFVAAPLGAATLGCALAALGAPAWIWAGRWGWQTAQWIDHSLGWAGLWLSAVLGIVLLSGLALWTARGVQPFRLATVRRAQPAEPASSPAPSSNPPPDTNRLPARPDAASADASSALPPPVDASST